MKLFKINFNNFIPFVNHPLFLEIPPAVRKSIDGLSVTHPNITIPRNFAKVIGLHKRVFDQITAPNLNGAKRGMLLYCSFALGYYVDYII